MMILCSRSTLVTAGIITFFFVVIPDCYQPVTSFQHSLVGFVHRQSSCPSFGRSSSLHHATALESSGTTEPTLKLRKTAPIKTTKRQNNLMNDENISKNAIAGGIPPWYSTKQEEERERQKAAIRQYNQIMKHENRMKIDTVTLPPWYSGTLKELNHVGGGPVEEMIQSQVPVVQQETTSEQDTVIVNNKEYESVHTTTSLDYESVHGATTGMDAVVVSPPSLSLQTRSLQETLEWSFTQVSPSMSIISDKSSPYGAAALFNRKNSAQPFFNDFGQNYHHGDAYYYHYYNQDQNQKVENNENSDHEVIMKVPLVDEISVNSQKQESKIDDKIDHEKEPLMGETSVHDLDYNQNQDYKVEEMIDHNIVTKFPLIDETSLIDETVFHNLNYNQDQNNMVEEKCDPPEVVMKLAPLVDETSVYGLNNEIVSSPEYSLVSVPLHLTTSDTDGQAYSYHHQDSSHEDVPEVKEIIDNKVNMEKVEINIFSNVMEVEHAGPNERAAETMEVNSFPKATPEFLRSMTAAKELRVVQQEQANELHAVQEQQTKPVVFYPSSDTASPDRQSRLQLHNFLTSMQKQRSHTTVLKATRIAMDAQIETSNTKLSEKSRDEIVEEKSQQVMRQEEYEAIIQSLKEELRWTNEDLEEEKASLSITNNKLAEALEQQALLQEKLIKTQREYAQRVMDLEARYKLGQQTAAPQAIDMERLQVDIKKKLRSAIRAANIEKELAIMESKSRLSSKEDIERANRRIAEIDEAIAELRAEKNSWRKLAQDSAAVVKTRVSDAVQKVFGR